MGCAMLHLHDIIAADGVLLTGFVQPCRLPWRMFRHVLWHVHAFGSVFNT
jgi:hypothetical protein